MNKQNTTRDLHQIKFKKVALFKQPVPQQANKPAEKVHSDSFVLEPIITVSGQRKFKKYEKLKKIGKGTYSQCFLVKTVGSDSQYALKIIPKNKLQVLIRQKLIYEIKIQQQLSHPNVVYLDHWFEDDDFQYIFMEYCSNGVTYNLQTKLQQMKQFPQSLIKFYTMQIIDSLMYIHSKGVLHRDLKMCNFYLDDSGNIKLGDFGFACQLNHLNQLKRETCGTPNYIAPQAISGFGYSFSADVWAVGVILYRMKFSCCPFQSSSVKQTLQNVKLCRYIFPKNQKISSQLKDLITKIFNINYDERLTLQQIYCHSFFEKQPSKSFIEKNELKKQKRGFSLTRLFSSSKQKPKKQGNKEPSKIQSSKNLSSNKNAPIRSNSCQTFKKIKQTFKEKIVTTIIQTNTMSTQENVYLGVKTQSLSTLGPTLTTRENSSRHMRDIIDNYNPMNSSFLNDFSKQTDRNSRLTQFLAKQKQESKPNKLIVKNQPTQVQIKNKNHFQRPKNALFDQLLQKFQKKYIFPYSFTCYKDIIIVSFSFPVRFLIYSKQIPYSQQKPTTESNTRQIPIQCEVLILYRNKYLIYNLKGEKVEQESLSKVISYVINKKVTFEEKPQTEEALIPDQSFESVLHKLPNQVLQKKEGILMIYGTRIKGYFVAKSHTQDLQYLASLQEKKLNTLFKHNSSKNVFEVQDGPVLAKIYSGWSNQLLSSYFGD